MAHIPTDAQWYIAEIVDQITVEDDPRSVVHKNLVLIRADSPETAYEKALSFGRDSETDYVNPDGKQVHIRFRGLSDLNVIHGELEDGAELMYEEKVGLTNESIERLISTKERLAVFCPIRSTKGPDYSSREILDEVRKLL
jgi:hypothetical protein